MNSKPGAALIARIPKRLSGTMRHTVKGSSVVKNGRTAEWSI